MMTLSVAELMAIDDADLRDGHLARLRVGGRDRWSKLDPEELRRLLGARDVIAIDAGTEGDASAATAAMRWRLRGLSTDRAIRVATVHREIEAAARAAYSAIWAAAAER